MIPILVSLIPMLVSQAETLLGPGKGTEKRQWVIDAFKEGEPLIKKIEPEAWQKYNYALEPILDTAIEFSLNALEK